ncbi:hypothetical protein D3C83_206620 [compost metagenome]
MLHLPETNGSKGQERNTAIQGSPDAKPLLAAFLSRVDDSHGVVAENIDNFYGNFL